MGGWSKFVNFPQVFSRIRWNDQSKNNSRLNIQKWEIFYLGVFGTVPVRLRAFLESYEDRIMVISHLGPTKPATWRSGASMVPDARSPWCGFRRSLKMRANEPERCQIPLVKIFFTSTGSIERYFYIDYFGENVNSNSWTSISAPYIYITLSFFKGGGPSQFWISMYIWDISKMWCSILLQSTC